MSLHDACDRVLTTDDLYICGQLWGAYVHGRIGGLTSASVRVPRTSRRPSASTSRSSTLPLSHMECKITTELNHKRCTKCSTKHDFWRIGLPGPRLRTAYIRRPRTRRVTSSHRTRAESKNAGSPPTWSESEHNPSSLATSDKANEWNRNRTARYLVLGGVSATSSWSSTSSFFFYLYKSSFDITSTVIHCPSWRQQWTS